MTLGSLFDGIGGFMLAGQYAGIRPVWSSEVEPFPMRVTEVRFPEVQQLGDVHAIHGGEIPPVDIITFGSPCQNLSIAGKRTGLDGEQSSLFFEAIRVIREMREATHGKYPRWAVWENVPGALSSNAGHDYWQVLKSLCGLCEESPDVPLPETGKWSGAGEIMGNHYSLAWRILDAAKGWGVAQRRRRIFAVLDLAGLRAGKLLFESEGLSGYSPPSREAWEGAAGTAAAGVGASGFCPEESAATRGVGYKEEEAPTLRAGVVPGVAIEYHGQDSRMKVRTDGLCQTLCSNMGTGGGNVPLTMVERNPATSVYCKGTRPHNAQEGQQWKEAAVSNTLNTFDVGEARCNELVVQAYGISSDQSNAMLSDNPHSGIYEAETSRTLDCNGGNPVCNQGGIAVVSYAIQGNMIGRKDENGPQGDGVNAEVSFTLNTVDRHAVCCAVADEDHCHPSNPAYSVRCNVNTEVQKEVTPALMARDYKDAAIVGQPAYCMTVGGYGHVAKEKTPTLEARGYKDPPVVGEPDSTRAAQYKADYLVRRLTTLECCRLQGYPDGWTENLGTASPTDEEIHKWSAVFENWARIQGKTVRPPSRNRIIRWLKNPRSESAEYKAYGNSVAVPCVFFVLAGIVWAGKGEKQHE